MDSKLDKFPPRHMRYPYTWAAKWVQFPFRYSFDSSYTFRGYCVAGIFTLFLFYQIDKLILTPENKAYTLKKQSEDYHYHYKRP